MLIINAEVDGVRLDVRFQDKILELSSSIQPAPGESVIDAQGGALLPGLHDHHMHFLATAAWANSVDCGAVDITGPDELGRLLRQQTGSGWLRGVNYHESIAGELQVRALDELADHRPVRIQHRSGKAWMLNSAAIELLQLQQYADIDGVEVDSSGAVTGRLFRLDGWLRERLSADLTSDISSLSRQLSSYGVTGFTDTSATNSQQTAQLFAQWQSDGVLQQDVLLMGDDSLHAGPLKVILDEDSLPDLENLVVRLQRARNRGRSIAFHCVSHLELLFALTALEQVPADSRDRIEHAAIVYDEMLPRLKQRGISVVTQPGFYDQYLKQRGDQYLKDLEPREIEVLYRHRALLEAGVNTVVSSDGPYGPVNPWKVMDAASRRTTQSGTTIGGQERVGPDHSLRGYLLNAHGLKEPAREIRVSKLAPMQTFVFCSCLGREAKKQVANVKVQATIRSGAVTHRLP